MTLLHKLPVVRARAELAEGISFEKEPLAQFEIFDLSQNRLPLSRNEFRMSECSATRLQIKVV